VNATAELRPLAGRRHAIAVVVTALLLSGCGPRSSPDPALVATLVSQSVAATIAARDGAESIYPGPATPTRVPPPFLTPRPPPSPTPAPRATPPATAPSGHSGPPDALRQAYGPIDSGEHFFGAISPADDVDAFLFDASRPGLVEVFLRELDDGAQYELAIYDSAGQLLSSAATGQECAPPNRVAYVVLQADQPGRYYVSVRLGCGRPDLDLEYDLQVFYPE